MSVPPESVLAPGRTHLDQFQRLLQMARDVAVGLAGFGHAGRVVVGENHGGRIVRQAAAHDLARMDAGAIDRPAEQLLAGDHAVAVVEEHAGEDLVRIAADARAQIVCAGGRVGHCVGPVKFAGQVAPPKFLPHWGRCRRS